MNKTIQFNNKLFRMSPINESNERHEIWFILMEYRTTVGIFSNKEIAEREFRYLLEHETREVEEQICQIRKEM